MKKIPTLFERVFENKRVVRITENVIDGMEWNGFLLAKG